MLERKLARGALVTTARFEDVLEIGRHYRREIYSLNPQVPPALIPRDRRVGIEERIRADGSVETALSERGTGGARREARRAGGDDGGDVPAQLVSSTREHESAHRRAISPARGPR